MSIWDAFGKGRYKGFSREAGQLLDKAVELAGGLGCKKADTGHLLWAMLQADGGPAARFLAGKNISELEVRRQLSAGRDGSVTRLARGDMAADLRRAMDYAIIGAQNAHLSRAEPEHLLCAMLEDTDCAAGVMLASMGVQLTEAVRRKPYSVILFDEVEKAHPDVFNILLQVLDDGRITDSQGRTVDFKNTVIILTSNLGSQFLLDGIGTDGEISQEARDQVNELLKRSFRPEFLNRLDEIVFYKPLTKENVTHIIDLMVTDLNRRLEDKQLTVELTPAAKDHIIEAAYDPIYGARPLRRYLQHTVETLISRKIVSDQVEPGSRITVECRDGELTVDSREVLTGEVVDG